MLKRSSPIVFDACCVFNLIASGCFLKIITAIPTQIMIAQTVWEEELINFDRFEESDRLQLDESVNNEIIQIVDFESESETDLAEKNKISDQDLKNVLKSVRVKGRYSPPREHPLANWWASITQN